MTFGLPRSLRGRTLLLTLVGIVACEFVTFAVLGIYRHALLTGRAHDFVNGQIEVIRSSLNHASPEDVARDLEHPFRRRMPRPAQPDAAPTGRDEGAPPPPPQDVRGRPMPPPDERFARGERGPLPRPTRMRLVQSPPESATADIPRDMALPQLAVALRQDYGTDALRFTESPEPAMWLRMAPGGWWLMLPVSRYTSPEIPWPVVFATLAAVAVMGGLVALYSVHLSRPLRSLAEAAARYKVGEHPEVALAGPDEIRAVIAQFNAMAERLERDDAERRVMLAGLPHDLRAPLARAKLRLELMDDAPDGPKAGLARDLAEVGRIADQFVAYLRGLDRDTTRFRPVALHEFVGDRAQVWHGSGHDVTVGRADPCTRPADADALMRAVDNLVGNAFAHGGAPVTIAGELTAGPDAVYRIVVRDHGPGIPEDRRAEAMKPFTRLDAARGASGHCGLGLAVAQAVARLHDGHLELGAAPGGGLEASIVMPIPA